MIQVTLSKDVSKAEENSEVTYKAHREARFNAQNLCVPALIHIFENWRRWYAKGKPMGAVSNFMKAFANSLTEV